MAESVRLINPEKIDRNKENPRLIFREDELQSLQESIKNQGILVPLAVFQNRKRFILLDGERRWRCALKLGLKNVPVFIQPKPNQLQNIMMMFAIHNARSDWDPLPTALKLKELEDVLAQRQGYAPTEETLAAAASLTRGEVRRYRRILSMPPHFRKELMKELEKPRNEQTVTVDHVLEATRGAEALRKRNIIDVEEENLLSRKIVEKFKKRVIKSTVDPRKLARISRAVEREEVSISSARRVVKKLISDPDYTIDQAFEQSVARMDFEHSTEQLISRLEEKLKEHMAKGYEPGEALRSAVKRLAELVQQFLRP